MKKRNKHFKCNVRRNDKKYSYIKLNLNYKEIEKDDVYGFYLTNKTTKNKVNSLPDFGNFVNNYPNFLALENEISLYNKTSETCVCRFREIINSIK